MHANQLRSPEIENQPYLLSAYNFVYLALQDSQQQ